MHKPRRAIDTLGHAIACAQAVIKPNEMKARADPSNANDDVKPPEEQIEPIENESIHACSQY
jgi:hypothetical protein